MLCAAPAYLAAHGEPRRLSELPAHACVTRTVGEGDVYRFTHQGADVDVRVPSAFRTDDTVSLRRAVLAGAGIGMLPSYYVGEALDSGALRRLLPGYEPATLGIHAVYLSRRHQPLALRALVDFLAERFGGDVAPWDRACDAGAALASI